jgi:hypothetical protein
LCGGLNHRVIGRATERRNSRLGRQHERGADREEPWITKQSAIGFPDRGGGGGVAIEA